MEVIRLKNHSQQYKQESVKPFWQYLAYSYSVWLIQSANLNRTWQGTRIKETFSLCLENQKNHHSGAPGVAWGSKDYAKMLLRNILGICSSSQKSGPLRTQVSALYSTDSIVLFCKMFKEGVTKSPLWHIGEKKEKGKTQ